MRASVASRAELMDSRMEFTEATLHAHRKKQEKQAALNKLEKVEEKRKRFEAADKDNMKQQL